MYKRFSIKISICCLIVTSFCLQTMPNKDEEDNENDGFIAEQLSIMKMKNDAKSTTFNKVTENDPKNNNFVDQGLQICLTRFNVSCLCQYISQGEIQQVFCVHLYKTSCWSNANINKCKRVANCRMNCMCACSNSSGENGFDKVPCDQWCNGVSECSNAADESLHLCQEIYISKIMTVSSLSLLSVAVLLIILAKRGILQEKYSNFTNKFKSYKLNNNIYSTSRLDFKQPSSEVSTNQISNNIAVESSQLSISENVQLKPLLSSTQSILSASPCNTLHRCLALPADMPCLGVRSHTPLSCHSLLDDDEVTMEEISMLDYKNLFGEKYKGVSNESKHRRVTVCESALSRPSKADFEVFNASLYKSQQQHHQKQQEEVIWNQPLKSKGNFLNEDINSNVTN